MMSIAKFEQLPPNRRELHLNIEDVPPQGSVPSTRQSRGCWRRAWKVVEPQAQRTSKE
ncbi:hypothetical protein CPC08DRAFT_710802 [Agrocybe pediades]|nr:hypothetical protein CPC08DRAFT_710802 [Agrocybe pediades]